MTTARQIVDMINNEQEHLLNCLARHVNKLSKAKQAEFGAKMKKNHTPEFIDDIKRRMRNESQRID